MRRFWSALFDGAIVSAETLEEMVRPRSEDVDGSRYGPGFWLAQHGPRVAQHGHDAGVSHVSWHDPSTGQTCTVMSNTSEGAGPMHRALAAVLRPD